MAVRATRTNFFGSICFGSAAANCAAVNWIANFALMLLKDGKIVATSNSPYDNVEHFSLGVKNSGDYAVQVYRTDEGGERNRVLNNPPTLGSISSLAVPAATTAGVQRSIDEPTSVPEPGLVGVLIGIAWITGVRRQRARP